MGLLYRDKFYERFVYSTNTNRLCVCIHKVPAQWAAAASVGRFWAPNVGRSSRHASLDEMLWLELGTRVSSSYCSVDPCVFNRDIVLARHGTAMSFLAAPVKTQRKLNKDK